MNFGSECIMKDTGIVISIGQLVSKDIRISIILINQFNALNPDSIYVMVKFTPQSVLLIVVAVLNLARSFHEVKLLRMAVALNLMKRVRLIL